MLSLKEAKVNERNPNTTADTKAAPEAVKPFEEPKLTYLTPKLSERGNVQDVTLQGFFGSFSP